MTIRFPNPDRYGVALINDDGVRPEFIKSLLRDHFHKNPLEVELLAMSFSRKGKVVVGSYPLHVAEFMADTAIDYAEERLEPIDLHLQPI